MFPPGASVLCAVSGGADSVALFEALLLLRGTLGLGSVAAAHYNHQLRGGMADADEAFVRSYCAQKGVALFVGRGDVAGEAKKRRANIEDTARVLRYDFLQETAQREGFSRIATGHTADDNIETVLLHLTRGAGLAGLAGIPPMRGNIARPLLGCTRSDVEAFLREAGISHVEDATNLDETLSRNRLRKRVIPELRALNPRLAEAIGGLSDRLRQDEEYLRSQAEEALATATATIETKEAVGVSIPVGILTSQPAAIANRLCRLLYRKATGKPSASLSAGHVKAILVLGAGESPSAQIDLPGGIAARREYEMLVIAPTAPLRVPHDPPNAAATHPPSLVGDAPLRVPPCPPPHDPPAADAATHPPPVAAHPPSLVGDAPLRVPPAPPRDPPPDAATPVVGDAPPRVPPAAIDCGCAGVSDRYHFFLAPDRIEGALQIRARQPGDRMRLAGKPGSRSLKRLMIDAKIPARLRAGWPVIADQNGVVAVPGLGADAKHIAKPGAAALEIRIPCPL